MLNKKPYKITAIIPTYNSWNTLKNCLNSLVNQSLTLQEIIVVDNASTDDSYKNITVLVKAVNGNQKSSIKLYRNTKNLGVTGGRNRGINEADKNADYLLFFDHDMVADKDMVKELVAVAQSSDDTGIITPKIYYYDQKDQIWSAGTGINLWTGQIIFRGGKDEGQFNKVEEVQVAPASFLVKREVIKKVKEFDDTYFATYEDTDFCFRARQHGFKTLYTPQALAYHKIPYNEQVAMQRMITRTYWIGRNRVIFMKRFGNNIFVFLAFLPVFFVYYLYLSIRYKNLRSFFNFVKGTIDGFLL